ncbi:MAG: carboxypeptidase regulatory-like domain-containing protein [Fibrobacteres bacterium]|nr:carboxypeptidase regulatory-like domain-containing protein [Fibrobacterota bacterium]
MDLRGTTLADSVTPIAHGVDGHCKDIAGASGVEADERRLEAFFFEKEIDPRPAATTSSSSGAYPHWLEKVEDTDDFENHGIHVQIIDAKKQPVPFAEVELKGPTGGSSTCDAHGFVSFTGLVKGEYTLASSKNGYKIGISKLKYPTAKTVPGHVKSSNGA